MTLIENCAVDDCQKRELLARIKVLETALKASRFVLIERKISPESRIIRVIDAALAPEQDK